jgi:DNA-binding transcriptional LysR family regulator
MRQPIDGGVGAMGEAAQEIGVGGGGQVAQDLRQVGQAVARHLSFSRAAEALSLSQPAVSKHIRLLEAELGARLFQRLGNRVELTEAGRLLADYAQRVSVLTGEVRRVLGELEGLKRGSLRLGASTTPGLYLLPEKLARFQQQHPDLEIALTFANSAAVARQVLSSELDLGFVGAAAETPGLQARPFAADDLVLIVPPGHALARTRTFHPDQLAQETLIVRESGSGTRQVVEAALARLGVRPRRTLELPGTEAARQCVAAGLGVAFVSRRAVALDAAQERVIIADIAELQFKRQLYILARKDARPSAASLAFLALMGKGDGR